MYDRIEGLPHISGTSLSFRPSLFASSPVSAPVASPRSSSSHRHCLGFCNLSLPIRPSRSVPGRRPVIFRLASFPRALSIAPSRSVFLGSFINRLFDCFRSHYRVNSFEWQATPSGLLSLLSPLCLGRSPSRCTGRLHPSPSPRCLRLTLYSIQRRREVAILYSSRLAARRRSTATRRGKSRRKRQRRAIYAPRTETTIDWKSRRVR